MRHAVRHRRWLAAATAGVAGLGVAAVVLLAVGVTRQVPETVQGGALPKMAVEGLRTSVYHGDRLQLRVAADALQVTNPRLLGPFRIGFLRSISARNVTVETFEDGGTAGARHTGALPMTEALSALAPEKLRKGIAHVEAQGVTLIQHRGGAGTVTLEADHCESATRPASIVCRNGSIRDGDGSVAFHEAVHDGNAWTIKSKRVP